MATELQLPAELWLQVFGFLSWRDKLSVRATCSHFRRLTDKSRPLWAGFSVALRHLQRYNRPFWLSLAQRRVGGVLLRSGAKKDVKTLAVALPALEALRLDDWRGGAAVQLAPFRDLRRLSLTSCSEPLKNLDFLLPLKERLTELRLCDVEFTCPPSHLVAAVGQLTRLARLQLHHKGGLRIPTLGGILAQLTALTHLSCTMITYKTLPQDFFSPAHLTEGGALPLTELQLLNYDAVVTEEALQPLSRLRSLSVVHLYSVPGPVCHLQTWLAALPQLRSLSVHGGHPLSAYADYLPTSLLSLSLCVDLEPDDLCAAAARVPHLQHLHLEPWSSSSTLVRLLPQLFPHLRTLRIRHRHVSDEDFLDLQRLRCLHTLEILDSYYKPDLADPGWIVYEPPDHLLRLISDLQTRTNHRIWVVTKSTRDPIACQCV
ncbi:unnamed protein product [Ophioblennius macclurei]